MINLFEFCLIDVVRRDLLLAPFDFDSLVDAIQREAQNIRFEKDKGTHEAKGAWRPTFLLDVFESTFDRYFNSPYGYRGQYLSSLEKGLEKNSVLISALIPKLVESIREKHEPIDQIRLSLSTEHAKIWIEEDQHNPRTPELIVQIKGPAWETAAKAVNDRLIRGDFTLTPKEIDRVYGVRAPVGTTLKIMGAWVDADGGIKLVPSKARRGEDIQAYGIS